MAGRQRERAEAAEGQHRASSEFCVCVLTGELREVWSVRPHGRLRHRDGLAGPREQQMSQGSDGGMEKRREFQKR